MAEPLNTYGDKFVPTGDGHGVDISSQRQDELDLQSVAAVKELAATGRRITALDLGGGKGAHSVRLAAAGADVTMIDIEEMATEHFAAAVQSGSVKPRQLRFVKKDFAGLTADDLPQDIDVFYSQRAIHYVPYDRARQALTVIFKAMASGGRAFVSAAGYDTEYGKTYPDRGKPVQDRFAMVTPDMQAKHAIEHKIVTYREEELAALLKDVGFTDVQVTHSAFGNIKAMARKP